MACHPQGFKLGFDGSNLLEGFVTRTSALGVAGRKAAHHMVRALSLLAPQHAAQIGKFLLADQQHVPQAIGVCGLRAVVPPCFGCVNRVGFGLRHAQGPLLLRV